LPKVVVFKKQVLAKLEGAKFSSFVPFESGFRFFAAVGRCNGITAISLDEFAPKLQIVPAESVQFHFEREDFQKWIKGTMKDWKLALRINGTVQGRSLEKRRKEILGIIQKRLAELRRPSL
jgi:hypothetical protein